MLQEESNPILKIIFLGDSSSGKTAILYRYINNYFYESNISTLGIDFVDKIIDYKNLKIILKIWDTSGQEKYNSILENFLINTDGIFIVFNLAEKETFYHAINRIKEVKEFNKNINLILIGNELDESNKMEISKETISRFVQKYNLKYFETNPKNGKNIKEMFDAMVDLILNGMTEVEIKKKYTHKSPSFNFVKKDRKKNKEYLEKESIKDKLNKWQKKLKSNESDKIEEEVEKNFPEETYKKFPGLMKYLDF